MAHLEVGEVALPLDDTFTIRIPGHRVVQDEAYVLYNIQLSLDQYSWTVERRYSEFLAFDKLRFPDRNKSFLPRKKIRGNLDAEFISERQLELQRYLKTVVEHEIYYQKKNQSTSLPLLIAQFLDFHQYVSLLYRHTREYGRKD